jgi:hypothetical protein
VDLLIDDGKFQPTRLELPANEETVIRVTTRTSRIMTSRSPVRTSTPAS